jgi:hypothetical protein
VVVYTPSILDTGIYMANLTLPPGFFWSDVIQPPGELPGCSDISTAWQVPQRRCVVVPLTDAWCCRGRQEHRHVEESMTGRQTKQPPSLTCRDSVVECNKRMLMQGRDCARKS